MPRLLYLSSSGTSSPDEDHLFNYLPDWDVVYVSPEIESFHNLSILLKEHEVHFIVFTLPLMQPHAEVILNLRQAFPLIPIIYYAPNLYSRDFQLLQRLGIKHCVVGDGRQLLLIQTLREMWKKHWKRIPAHLLPMHESEFTKKVVEIIQNEPIKNLNIRFIAQKMQMTDDQVRETFKKQFGQNFRAFKQALLDHYETHLLFKKGLKPGKIYSALNYQNLSAFSRSFRIRHGSSWQAAMRLQNGS
ncbi:hypothetical protein DRI50_01070 [candidate division KSB1 bacterium]|nr:MAG: hypothetical protein DRI50_01070 [candidate division KSB1 bacterium]